MARWLLAGIAAGAVLVATSLPASAVIPLGPVQGYSLPPTWTEALLPARGQRTENLNLTRPDFCPDAPDGVCSGRRVAANVNISVAPRQTYASPDEWAAPRSDGLAAGAPTSGLTVTENEATTATVAGIDGYRWIGAERGTVTGTDPDGVERSRFSSSRREVYLLPAGDVEVTVEVTTLGEYVSDTPIDALPEPYASDLQAALAEAASLVDSLQIVGGTGADPAAPPADGGTEEPTTAGWRTVVGGLGAVAAAAAALAGLRGRTADGRERARRDPNAPVGHVLQLSSNSLHPAPGRPAPLAATAWLVRASGAFEQASDVTVSLQPPAGIAVVPSSGAGSVRTDVTVTGDRAPAGFITVLAQGAGGGTSARVDVGGGAGGLVLSLDPPGARELRPDGRDRVTVVARIEPTAADRAAGLDVAAAASTIRFGEPSSWGHLSAPAPWGSDGQAATLQAWSPDPASHVTPPEHVELYVAARIGTREQSQRIVVALAAPPALEVEPDEVRVPVRSGRTVPLSAWVEHPGTERWTIAAEWTDPEIAPGRVHVDQQADAPSATIEITEAAAAEDEPPTRSELVARLTVTATAAGGERLEREVRLIVAREGLFADTVGAHPDGTFHVKADGSKEPKVIDFRIMVADPTTGEISSDPARLADLTFAPVAPERSPERNLFEFSKLTTTFDGPTAERSPAGAWRFAIERDCPGRGAATRVRLRASVPGLDPDRFSCDVPLGYELSKSPTPADRIEIERQRAQAVIDTFAPPRLLADLQRLLDTEGTRLGPEGLAELRRRIWEAAADAVLEDAEGYLREAAWNDKIIRILDWATWMGDLAFGALVNSYFGAAPAMAITVTKPMIISALNAYRFGQTPEQWLSEQVWSVLYLFEGRTIDVDRFSQLGGIGRAKCWALFCTYHFFKSLYQQKQKSIMQALQDTTWQVTDAVLAEWLGRQVGAEMARRGIIEQPRGVAPAEEEAARTRDADQEARRTRDADDGRLRTLDDTTVTPRQRQAMDEVSRQVATRTTVGEDGRPRLDRQTTLEIMRDPQRARLLKEGGTPEAREAFANSRRDLMAAHDSSMRGYVADLLGVDPSDIRVADTSTPGKATDFSTDRDYTMVVRRQTPDGREVWVEVPRQQWDQQSHLEFAQATGGPGHSATPAERRAWAEAHQMMATDRYHVEASPDFSPQRLKFDEATGRAYYDVEAKPNIMEVREGRATLISPETLGQMYKQKVTDAVHHGNVGDAYVQARKGSEQLRAVREGYARNPSRYDVGTLPPAFEQASRVVEGAGRNFGDPDALAAADARLRDLGFDGVSGYGDALRTHIESLKLARPTA